MNISSMTSKVAGFFGRDENDLEAKRMKMLDELRNSVSSEVWQSFGDYAKSKLQATSNMSSLNGVFKELKGKAAEEQSEVDETQTALQERDRKDRERKGCEDVLTISVEARQQIEARSAA